jgi:arginase
MMPMRPIQVVAAASGIGARDPGCARGPDTVHYSGLLARLKQRGLDISWRDTLRPALAGTPLSIIHDLDERLARQVCDSAATGNLPLVLGGDHSCAIGTWSGAALSLKARGPLGLVWVDAHMDSHTPETTPSGAIHGMPLAALLGYGARELVDLAGFSPKLLPRHVCLVGVRSYEAGEAALLQRLGVRVFFMAEVKRRGIDTVMADALAIARNGTAGFGISIDLDAFSPRESPGVGTPVRDGLLHLELGRVLRGIGNIPELAALELAEFNPLRDHSGRTLGLIEDLLLAIGQKDGP